MFILFGTRHTRSIKGTVYKQFTCQHCNNVTPFQLVKDTDWFTLYMIPVIPMKTSYRAECPICRYGFDVEKERAKEIINELNNSNNQ